MLRILWAVWHSDCVMNGGGIFLNRMKTRRPAVVYPNGQLSFIQIQGGSVMLSHFFDPEMLTIYSLSLFSGAIFFYMATREPHL